MDFTKDYYGILELALTATKEEIRASYRKLVKLYHPDLHKGDLLMEEKLKSINEAYDILISDILRFEYDENRKLAEEWRNRNRKFEQSSHVGSANKKTYLKRTTKTEETKIYIKGQIIIKYEAESDKLDSLHNLTELFLKIVPIHVNAVILETDIYPTKEIPSDYLKAYSESQIFKSPIRQPVKCSVNTASGNEYYELELKDIRIRDIKLSGVTKHETQSFGTLTGDFFAYHSKYDSFEEIEEVTECFGLTGEVEKKQEDGENYIRHQYFNPDCTKVWGSWKKVPKPKSTVKRGKTKLPVENTWGCLTFWWIPLLLLLVVLNPGLLIPILILIAFYALLSFGGAVGSVFKNVLGILFLLSFSIIILTALMSGSSNTIPDNKSKTKFYDTLVTSKRVVTSIIYDSSSNTVASNQDTLISHFIKWRNYKDSSFEGYLTVSAADVNSSADIHRQMNPYFFTNSITPAYEYMLEGDSGKLRYLYSTFDSLRTFNKMDDLTFARTIVSCIQSIPYVLILDKGCNDYYADKWIQDYLSACTRECCLGNVRYGVRSPAEFLSDLKGDCDTRALLLYQIFAHYNFDVALITSDFYKHAMIALHLKTEPDYPSMSMNINKKNYYLWETTDTGFDVGMIPVHHRDLSYWDIALLHKKRQL